MKIHSFEKAKFKKLLKSEEQFAILRGNIHARNDHASVSPYHDLRITRSNSYLTYKQKWCLMLLVGWLVYF